MLLHLNTYDLTSNFRIYFIPLKCHPTTLKKQLTNLKRFATMSLWQYKNLSTQFESFMVQCITSTYWKLLAFLGSIWNLFNSKAASRVPLIRCPLPHPSDDMWLGPSDVTNQAEVDHRRLLFFQIRVENLKRGSPGFQFFAYFMTFLTSSDLRTNHSAVLWVRRGPSACAWVVLIWSIDTKSYTTENRVDPSLGFQP